MSEGSRSVPSLLLESVTGSALTTPRQRYGLALPGAEGQQLPLRIIQLKTPR